MRSLVSAVTLDINFVTVPSTLFTNSLRLFSDTAVLISNLSSPNGITSESSFVLRYADIRI